MTAIFSSNLRARLRRCDVPVSLLCAFVISLWIWRGEDELWQAGGPFVLAFALPAFALRLLSFTGRGRQLSAHANLIAGALVFALLLGKWPAWFPDRHAVLRSLVLVTIVWLPLLAIWRAQSLLRAWREVVLVMVSSSLLLLLVWAAGPSILRRIVLPDYNLDVDHHPLPSGPETNEDGLRDKRPATDFKADDFNIIILGDSFTWASAVPAQDGFVPGVERELRTRFPALHINVANFGWISSSPVLQARRLMQIGARYHPKLVVQCFDMTDFHDDLTYIEKFHDENVENGGAEITIFQALWSAAARLLAVADLRPWLRQEARFIPPSPPRTPYKVDKPNQRYFFLFRPYEESAPLARVSWDAIQRTEAVSRRMGADYALFVMPRYQQYNRNEAPLDSEKPEFPASDEYLFEPFRYFEAQAKTVRFPIHSLVDAFRSAKVFPTTPANDPHWNAAGNRIAADAITRLLIADGFFGATVTAPPPR